MTASSTLENTPVPGRTVAEIIRLADEPLRQREQNQRAYSHDVVMALACRHVNPFADAAIFLALTSDNLSYRRFLERVCADPDSTENERTTAASQLEHEHLWRGGFNELQQSLLDVALTSSVSPLELDRAALELSRQRPVHQRGYAVPLSLTHGLPDDQLVSYARRFIDARDHAIARVIIRAIYRVPAEEADRHLYEYYLADSSLNNDASYDVAQWRNFVRAQRYIEAQSELGRPYSYELLRELNGIFLHGVPTQAVSLVRTKGISLIRSREHFDALFEPDGRYRSSVPAGTTEVKASILFIRSEDIPEAEHGAEIEKVLEKHSERFARAPQAVPVESDGSSAMSIVLLHTPEQLAVHMDRVVRYFAVQADLIVRDVRSGELRPGSATYVQRVTALAAQVARAGEYVHFPNNANGRTGLGGERYICLLFGFDLPDTIDGSITVSKRRPDGTVLSHTIRCENATWMREGERSRLLCQGALARGIDPVRCAQAIERYACVRTQTFKPRPDQAVTPAEEAAMSGD